MHAVVKVALCSHLQPLARESKLVLTAGEGRVDTAAQAAV